MNWSWCLRRRIDASFLVAAGIACGPDPKPEEPCTGPTFNLTLRAPDGPLPDDTEINVRYGGNNDGEPYALGEMRTSQAVFCSPITGAEDAFGSGGAGAKSDGTGAGGAEQPNGVGATSGADPTSNVVAIECRLYTQGPARLDVRASGYAPIVERDLTLGEKRCQVEVEVVLELPDVENEEP